MKYDYRKLYIELKKTNFFYDLRADAQIDGFRIGKNFTACMEPHGIGITCALPGYSRSRGNIVVPNVRVVEFFNDGSAWIAQPGKLADAMVALKKLIKQRKEENDARKVAT